MRKKPSLTRWYIYFCSIRIQTRVISQRLEVYRNFQQSDCLSNSHETGVFVLKKISYIYEFDLYNLA